MNKLTTHDKYSLLNRDNFGQTIKMQSSPKQEFFSEFVFAFWQSILNFGHFLKKDDPHS